MMGRMYIHIIFWRLQYKYQQQQQQQQLID